MRDNKNWTAEDEAQLARLQKRKADVVAGHTDAVLKVLERFYYQDMPACELAESAIDNAEALIDVLERVIGRKP